MKPLSIQDAVRKEIRGCKCSGADTILVIYFKQDPYASHVQKPCFEQSFQRYQMLNENGVTYVFERIKFLFYVYVF